MSSHSGGVGFGGVIVFGMLLAAIWAVVVMVFTALVWGAIIIAWLLAFIAFSLTFACLLAWQRPFHLGHIYIASDDARAFIKRGLFGAIMAPLFLLLCEHLLDVGIRWDWFWYFALAGYTAFSVGIEYLIARQMDVPYVQYEVLPVQTRLPRTEQNLLLPDKTHRFATWDDEEERR